MTGDLNSECELSFVNEQHDRGHDVKLEWGTQPQQQQAGLHRSCNGTGEEHRTPWLLWPVFAFAVMAAASSGPIIVLVQGAGPISFGGWRFQVTALVLLPGFIHESIRLSKLERRKMVSSPNYRLHLLRSVALAGHIAAYTSALYHTSVPHCMFLVNTSPVFVALYVKIAGGDLIPAEIGGIILGLLGMGIFALGNKFEGRTNSSHIGDLLSIMSAISTATYLLVGKTLRSWMPLFVYQFPVAFGTLIILSVAGLILEGWNESDTDLISGPFGWLRKEYWLQVVYLGVAPGVVGHVGYSYVLKYSSPLVMPCGLSLSAIIGSFLSWLLGQTPIPGVWTWGAGLLTLSGTMIVSITSALRQNKMEAKEEHEQQHALVDDKDLDQSPLLTTKPTAQVNEDLEL